MFRKIRSFIAQYRTLQSRVDYLYNQQLNDCKNMRINIGQMQAQLNASKQVDNLSEVEFQVFSQWGDDGIIQYLISKIDIQNKTFIEFGVENYRESNTRFLLVNNKWQGLVIDGSKENIDYIKKDVVSYAYILHAAESFVGSDNINSLIQSFLDKGYSPEVGLLSIDIDGNDYWVWGAIAVINPVIVIVEYNSVFGQKPWTIPYDRTFNRNKKDKTCQYWGAGLKALCMLAEEKGYYFVGCNSNGNNSYFIRKDKIGTIKPLTSEQGFVQATFREYIDANGERIGGVERLELIRDKRIYNVEIRRVETI